MNLPNTISAARIVASPILAAMAFVPSVAWRAVAFVLYLVTAISDHYDGKIAREQGLITDLGKWLDPLADKLLLLAAFVPMFVLQAPASDPLLMLLPTFAETAQYPFTTWGASEVFFPWWVLVAILGREAFMTWFRGFATRRGVAMAAQKLGKWKAGFQFTWMGASFFWFGYRLLIEQQGWGSAPHAMFWARVLGGIGTITMYVALALTLISLADYLVSYRRVFTMRAR